MTCSHWKRGYLVHVIFPFTGKKVSLRWQCVGPQLPHRPQKWDEDFQIVAPCALLKTPALASSCLSARRGEKGCWGQLLQARWN